MTIFSKTKAFCFISQNPLDKLQYSLVFTKFHVFSWVANFQGLTTGFTRLPTLTRTFIVRYICLTKNTEFFTQWGIYFYLLYPTHVFFIFFFFYATLRLILEVISFTKVTQSNTKHNVDLLTMHSHPFNVMSPCICNARCHCMLYHVTCIMNATWTTQSTPLTDVIDNHITCI